MPAPSYLSTFLFSQQLRGAEAFAAKYVGDWLVWEPGPWQAPARNTLSTFKADVTSTTPQQGDALCFLIGPANGRSLRVGRDPGNDLLISDGTVSRQHVVLTGADGSWTVKATAGRKAIVGGVAIPETGLKLVPGAMLKLGGVSLSFHDCASLLRRLVH
jgi:hypothetical protein